MSRIVCGRGFSIWRKLLATYVLEPRASARTKNEIKWMTEPERRRKKKGKESGKGGRRHLLWVDERNSKEERKATSKAIATKEAGGLCEKKARSAGNLPITALAEQVVKQRAFYSERAGPEEEEAAGSAPVFWK